MSRIGTLFAKLGLLAGGWNATLSYSGATNKIYQAGSLPDDVVDARPDSNFTGGDYFAPLAHQVTLNAQRALGSAQLSANVFGRRLDTDRSEEHTSELQSLAYLVCRLLLEKKKTTCSTPLPLIPSCTRQACR